MLISGINKTKTYREIYVYLLNKFKFYGTLKVEFGKGFRSVEIRKEEYKIIRNTINYKNY